MRKLGKTYPKVLLSHPSFWMGRLWPLLRCGSSEQLEVVPRAIVDVGGFSGGCATKMGCSQVVFTVTVKDHEIFSYEYLTWKHQTWQVETWLQLVEATCATWLEVWGMTLGSDFMQLEALGLNQLPIGEVDIGSLPSHTCRSHKLDVSLHNRIYIYSVWWLSQS